MIKIEGQAWPSVPSGTSEAVRRQVAAVVPDSIVILDAGGDIAFLNSAAGRLLGIPRDPVSGRPLTGRSLNLLTPDGEPLSLDTQTISTRLSSREFGWDLEARFDRADGRQVPLSVSVDVLTSADAAVTGIVLSLRDVTAQWDINQGVQAYVDMLRAQAELLDLAHDAIFVRDVSTGIILYWNRGAEAVYGYRRDEAVGKVSHQLLHTQFPAPLAEIEETVIRDGEWAGELVQHRSNKAEVMVESRWAVQRDAEKQPIAFLEINRDITARKQAEAELGRRVEELGVANGELARRHRDMVALNASMSLVSQSVDICDVLQNIADAARELVHARYAALGVADAQGHITQFITSGITAEQRAAIGPLPEGHGLLGALIKEARPLRIPTIADDPGSHGFPPNHPPMTSLLGVPIIARGQVLGDLYLTDKIDADEFTDVDESLLMLLAGQAAVAIENGQLYEEMRSARDQLRRWNRDLESTVAERTREIGRMSRETAARVLQAQEEERGRIARELHDETAQSLARLLIDLDLIKQQSPVEGPLMTAMHRLEHGLRRTWEEVRALSHDLRPAILEDFGLGPALESYVDDWKQTFGVPVHVDIHQTGEERLSAEWEIAIFRVAQEAMMNAGKYARAHDVHISLSITAEEVHLSIQDDGVGFAPDRVQAPTRHAGLGLLSMRERAALLDGNLTITSAPGEGTQITFTAPNSPIAAAGSAEDPGR